MTTKEQSITFFNDPRVQDAITIMILDKIMNHNDEEEQLNQSVIKKYIETINSRLNELQTKINGIDAKVSCLRR